MASMLIGTLGIFLVAGLAGGGAGCRGIPDTSPVTSNRERPSRFDEAVIRWIGAHHTHSLEAVMLEVTSLGTGTVVMMIVGGRGALSRADTAQVFGDAAPGVDGGGSRAERHSEDRLRSAAPGDLFCTRYTPSARRFRPVTR